MAHLKRRRVLVSHAQVRLVTLNLAYFSLLVSVLYVGVWSPLSQGLFDDSLSLRERAQVGKYLLYLHTRLLPICLGAAIVFAVHTVLLSHRILGPLVHFCSAFRRIGQGRLTQRIRLRKRDYLHDEARQLDEMRESLRIRLLRIQSINAEAYDAWRSISIELQAGSVEKETMAWIEALVKQCESEWEQLELDHRKVEDKEAEQTPQSQLGKPAVQSEVSEERLAS